MVVDVHASYMKSYVIEQLEGLGIRINDDLTYKELVTKLAIEREKNALNIKVENPESSWF